MRCRTARRLMLLYREGEVPATRAARLGKHYASCPTCAQEAGLLPGTFAPLDALRRQQPVLEDPHGLVLSIVREVERADRPAELPAIPNPGRLLAGVRVATGAAAAGLAMLLVILSTGDATRVAALERDLLQRHTGNEDPAGQLTREAWSLVGAKPGGASARQVIRPDEAGMLLKFLLQPGGESARVTVEDLLRHKYPALASVTLENGLDERERAILAGEGTRFVKDLEKLIRKEKGNHER